MVLDNECKQREKVSLITNSIIRRRADEDGC